MVAVSVQTQAPGNSEIVCPGALHRRVERKVFLDTEPGVDIVRYCCVDCFACWLCIDAPTWADVDEQ